MRPDDGGGDGPEDRDTDGATDPGFDDLGSTDPGALPDPSLRHWRHPSELARHHALPHHTPTSPTPTTGSTSVVWPVVAVGGFLAVAAIGAIGLQATVGAPGSIQANDPGAEQVIGLPASDDAHPDRSTSTVSWSGDGTLNESEVTSTPAVGTANADSAEIPRSREGTEATTRPPVTAAPVAAVPAAVPVFGLYTSPGPEGRQVGSFTVVADEVVTSAASVEGATTVWLRVRSDWVEARVAATDPLTDVALLDLIAPHDHPDTDDDTDDDTDEDAGLTTRPPTATLDRIDTSDLPDLPLLAISALPVAVNDLVLVGYGDSTSDPSRSTPERPVAATTGPPPTVSAGAEPDAPAPAAVDRTGDGPLPTLAVTADLDADDLAWLAVSAFRGRVFSVDHGLLTAHGRLIADPIWAAIDERPEAAGAPLRDQEGDLVGVVITAKAQVAAVPIARVIDAVHSLRQHGTGDTVRLSVEVATENGRLVVRSVGSDSVEGNEPAARANQAVDAGPDREAGERPVLQPGDVILSIDGRTVSHPDHLAYLARRSGIGGQLVLVVERGRRWFSVGLEVDSVEGDSP